MKEKENLIEKVFGVLRSLSGIKTSRVDNQSDLPIEIHRRRRRRKLRLQKAEIYLGKEKQLDWSSLQSWS
jgi:hypothetical protein